MRFEWKPWLLATVVGAALLAAAPPATALCCRRQDNHEELVLALLAAAPPATAQNEGRPYYYPYLGTMPYGISQGTGYPAYTPTTITNTTPPAVSNPYSSYYNSGGYPSGAADLVSAYTNNSVTYQNARLVQQFLRSQVDTRRKKWEEARNERANLMNSEQLRQLFLSGLERARHNPPQEEIWSGQSLNDLFEYLATQRGMMTQWQIELLPQIPITEDVLKHINLTAGKDGNVGLLQIELHWPTSLQRPEFEKTRKTLDKQLQEALRQAKVGAVNTNLTSDIKSNVQQMKDILLKTIDSIQPDDYQKAKNYLARLDDWARALSDPKGSKYFNGKWSSRGMTVDSLIEDMSTKGQKFAPGTPGDEAAYTALYRALRDYDAGMMRQFEFVPPTPKP